MAVDEVEHVAGLELESEFEHVSVPQAHRKPWRSVAAVWFGFPMILTCAVFGGVITAFLGFQKGLLAIVLGDLALFLYVGALSYLAGATGLNFALTATRVFGRYGYVVASGFLATIVTGWFAFQTGLTGATVSQSFGWNEKLVIVIAGALYIAVTFIGIRALSLLGAVAAPMFILLAAITLVLIARNHSLSAIWNYAGLSGGTAGLSLGAGVTLVVATFADSGTMTGDFTRWSRNGREGVAAAFTAFPIANLVAFIVGGIIVASGAVTKPDVNGGNFLPMIAHGHGTLLSVLAFLFIFVNLGSVCTHCLYNGAVGWSHILRTHMRLMTLVLGVIGTLAALAGIWTHFLTYLNVLGIFVPPIGAVVITDQLFLRGASQLREPVLARWTAFLVWAIAAAVAYVVHYHAPQLADAVVGMAVAVLAYSLLAVLAGSSLRGRQKVTAPASAP